MNSGTSTVIIPSKETNLLRTSEVIEQKLRRDMDHLQEQLEVNLPNFHSDNFRLFRFTFKRLES